MASRTANINFFERILTAMTPCLAAWKPICLRVVRGLLYVCCVLIKCCYVL